LINTTPVVAVAKSSGHGGSVVEVVLAASLATVVAVGAVVAGLVVAVLDDGGPSLMGTELPVAPVTGMHGSVVVVAPPD